MQTQIYCAFLRGVNVKGTKIFMHDLTRVFHEMGLSDARTILATGNVVFSSNEAAAVLKQTIETGLSEAFHYEAYVFLRNMNQVQTILQKGAVIPVSPDFHRYLLLVDDAKAIIMIQDLFDSLSLGPEEQLMVDEDILFWVVPKNSTLDSAFGSKLLGKKYKASLTTRNLNTIEKVLAEMKKRLV